MAKLARVLVNAIVEKRPPKPGAAYWCPYCGDSIMPDAAPTNIDRHLSGQCGKEIMAKVEELERAEP